MFPRLFTLLALGLGFANSLLAANVAPTLSQPLSERSLVGAVENIDLSAFITDPDVPGPAVRVTVRRGTLGTGTIDLALDTQHAPLTVANFLAYINAGRYAANIIHRSEPGFVIQGGGFAFSSDVQVGFVQAFAAVQNEPGVSNLRGTVAMAKLGDDPNSATSQWFVNLADTNAATPGGAMLDSQNGGFTVFGRVVGNGMTVADAVAAMQRFDNSGFASAWDHMPMSASALSRTNVVETSMAVISPLAFTATSSSGSLVTVSISGKTLQLRPVAGKSGSATVTVSATDLDGAKLTTSFSVAVALPAVPKFTAGPTAATVNVGADASLSAIVTGTPSPTLQWQRAPKGSSTFANLVDSTTFSGATTATLSVAATQPGMNGDQFRLVATNIAGTATSAAVALTVRTPPAIVAAPAARTVTAGQTANFTVSASGTAPLAFIWQRAPAESESFTTLTNGAGITGAATATLSIASTTTAMSGARFRAVVSNSLGTATSSAATLTVNKAAATVTISSLTQTFSGSSKSATVTTNPAGLAVAITYDGSATAPTNPGSYPVLATITDANRTGSAAATLIIRKGPATVSLSGLAQTFTGKPQNVGVTTTPANLPVSITYNNSTTPPTNAGTYTVVATIVDDLRTGSKSGSLVIAKAAQSISFAALPAAKVGDEPLSLTATASSGLPVSFTSSNPAIATVNGSTLTLVGKGTVTITAKQTGGTNFVAAPAVARTLTVLQAPAIATPPANKSVTAGQTATLTVTASGSAPLNFQWQVSTDGGEKFANLDNGNGAAGATTATLSITTTTGSATFNANQYRAVVTNTAGTATSSAATLTLKLAPKIITPPVSLTVTEGQTVSLSVVATGLPMPTYQWKKGTATLSGATGEILTFESVATSDSGSYTVVVTNASGSVTSSAVTLSVSVRSPNAALASVSNSGSSSAGALSLNRSASQSLVDNVSAGELADIGAITTGTHPVAVAVGVDGAAAWVTALVTDLNLPAPTVADLPPLLASAMNLDGSSPASLLPVTTIVTVGGEQRLALQFRARKDLTGLRLAVLASADLRHWDLVPAANIVALEDADADTASYEASVPMTVGRALILFVMRDPPETGLDEGEDSVISTGGTLNLGASGTLVRSGGGTVTMSGSNLFTGNVVISTGTLSIANSDGLVIVGQPLTVNPDSLGSGSLVSGGALSIYGGLSSNGVEMNSIAQSGSVTLNLAHNLDSNSNGSLSLVGGNTAGIGVLNSSGALSLNSRGTGSSLTTTTLYAGGILTVGIPTSNLTLAQTVTDNAGTTLTLSGGMASSLVLNTYLHGAASTALVWLGRGYSINTDDAIAWVTGTGSESVNQTVAAAAVPSPLQLAMNLTADSPRSHLPRTTVATADGVPRLSVQYRLNKNLVVLGLRLVAQTSVDNVTWTDVPLSALTALPDDDSDTARLEANVQVPVDGGLLLRLVLAPIPAEEPTAVP